MCMRSTKETIHTVSSHPNNQVKTPPKIRRTPPEEDDVSNREPRGPLAGWHVDQVTERSGRRSPRAVIGGQYSSDHRQIRGQRGQGTDHPERWSVVSSQMAINKPVPRLTPGGRTREANRALISHRVPGHRGLVLHAVKLGLRFPARALHMDLAWAHLRESRTRVAWGG